MKHFDYIGMNSKVVFAFVAFCFALMGLTGAVAVAEEADPTGSLSYMPVVEDASSNPEDDQHASITISYVDSFKDLVDASRLVPEPAEDPLKEIRVTGEGSSGVVHRVKSQESEWSSWNMGSETSSSQGAIADVQFKLSDDLADEYSIVYRVHVANNDWLGWAADGESAGYDETDSFIDGIDIALVSKSDSELSSELAAQIVAPYVSPKDDADSNGNNTDSVENGSSVDSDDSGAEENAESDQQDEADSDDGTAGLLSAQPMLLMSGAQQLSSTAQTARPGVSYQAHVQDIGWMDWVADGATAGTTGRSLRVEAFGVKLNGIEGSIEYRTHVQNIGWMNWVTDGATAGTTGKSLRVEALQMKLTGTAAQNYDIYYRAHVQNVGWTAWSKNGETAGTTGRSLRIEAVQVLLVGSGDPVPTVDGPSYTELVNTVYEEPTILYQAHVQDVGWQNEVSDGATSGTTGRSLRIEGVKFAIAGINGGIEYRAHVQNEGWQSWVQNGSLSGTVGKSLRIEALELRLTGNAATNYDVYYRVHVSDIGWMGWAKNGETAGSVGLSRKVEAVQAVLVAKGSATPSNEGSVVAYASVTKPNVTYSSNIQSQGWGSNASNGATSGNAGQSLAMVQLKASLDCASSFGAISYRVSTDGTEWSEQVSNGSVAGDGTSSLRGVRLKLSGDVANYCDVWYRVYVSGSGWLGWTRNDGFAGTNIPSKSIEGIQIQVLKKGGAAPGSTTKAFARADRLNGIDIASYQAGINLSQVNADFVFVKATEGTWYLNKNVAKGNDYRGWADAALASGKLLGFYHYANGGDPIAEANYFYNAIKDYKGKAVVALDWEGQDNDLFNSDVDVTWCKKFLDRIASLMDAKPLIYMSKSVTRKYDWSTVACDYPLWAAQYANTARTGYKENPWTDGYTFGAWSSPMVYQYSGNGRLTGYDADLDLDLFYGSADDWRVLQ